MKLKEWVASYSGCDGGSIEKSSIWFVGIEWGYAKGKGQTDEEHEKSISTYHKGEMSEAIKVGYEHPCLSSYPLKEHTGYIFGLNSTKLLCAIKGQSVGNYQDFALETLDTDILKLNLYPIALPYVDDSLWKKFNLSELTGLANKKEYRDYCAKYRFPFFRSELKKNSPSLVLCTGVTYVENFAKCFCDIDDMSQLNREEISDSSSNNNSARTLYWKWINEDSLFVTVPFVLGPQGLNSNDLLQKFGDRICEILKLG